MYKVVVVVLIFQQSVVIDFQKLRNTVQVSVVLLDENTYLPTLSRHIVITTISRSLPPAPMVDIRTGPSNGYGQQTNYGNDYASSSILTRSSSSYGGQGNDLGQTRVSGGGGGGGYGGNNYGSASDK